MTRAILAIAILCVGALGTAFKFTRNDAVSYLNLSQPYSVAAQTSLRKNGFTVIPAPGEANGFGAELNGCIIWGAPSQADGDNDTSFLVAYQAGADVLFLYDNQIYSARPNFRFLFERLKVRGLRSIGIDASVSPIFAVAVSKSCDENSRSTAIKAVANITAKHL